MTQLLTAEPLQLLNNDLADVTDPSELELREEIVRIGKQMHALGYSPGTAGNLSIRLDHRRILASPTGCSKSLLKSEDMVIVDLDGHKLSGSRNVTSEIGMHLTVYRMRPDITAVVHTHPPIATAFAACRRALNQPLCSEILMTTGLVPLARYATTGTDEVSASLEPFIPHHDAILLANHGLITYGQSLMDAFMKTETVEHFAQVCLAAHQLGGAIELNQEDLNKLQFARTRYKQNSACQPATF
jgi:L-fuculose-phosphate aldolase